MRSARPSTELRDSLQPGFARRPGLMAGFSSSGGSEASASRSTRRRDVPASPRTSRRVAGTLLVVNRRPGLGPASRDGVAAQVPSPLGEAWGSQWSDIAEGRTEMGAVVEGGADGDGRRPHAAVPHMPGRAQGSPPPRISGGERREPRPWRQVPSTSFALRRERARERPDPASGRGRFCRVESSRLADLRIETYVVTRVVRGTDAPRALGLRPSRCIVTPRWEMRCRVGAQWRKRRKTLTRATSFARAAGRSRASGSTESSLSGLAFFRGPGVPRESYRYAESKLSSGDLRESLTLVGWGRPRVRRINSSKSSRRACRSFGVEVLQGGRRGSDCSTPVPETLLTEDRSRRELAESRRVSIQDPSAGRFPPRVPPPEKPTSTLCVGRGEGEASGARNPDAINGRGAAAGNRIVEGRGSTR